MIQEEKSYQCVPRRIQTEDLHDDDHVMILNRFGRNQRRRRTPTAAMFLSILLFSATLLGSTAAFSTTNPAAATSRRSAIRGRRSPDTPLSPSFVTTTRLMLSQVKPNLETNHEQSSKQKRSKRERIAQAVQIYTEYAGRLWNETTPEVRQQIEREKATKAIQQVIQQIQNDDDSNDHDQEIQSDGSHHDDDDNEAEDDAPLDPMLLQDLINACNQAILKSEQPPQSTTQGDAAKDESSSSLSGIDDLTTSTTTTTEGLATLESTEHDNVHSVDSDDQGSNGVTTTIYNAKANGDDNNNNNPEALEHSDRDVALAKAAAVAAVAGTSTVVVGTEQPDTTTTTTTLSSETVAAAVPKKKRRSIWFGAGMGAVVACWVFSGNYVFTGLFTLMTTLGQLEYYRMVINTGVYPARRISVIGACSMFWTALFCPQHHQIVLPLFGLWAMIWFLTMKRTVTTIPEIATTFTGMFYLGYVPSFWVRIRLLGAGREATRLAPLVGPLLNLLHIKAENNLPAAILKTIHLPITTGAIFIFWTWLCLAFNDVFAYFVGKNLGRVKLGQIAPAAGATSPNKTVEGVLGGCAVSAALGMLGAWVQKWPFWALTGMVHGTLLGLIGLIGDLTASMIKRDAGIKDFGDLIPEHGGILDRVDGFIWTAPYSWFVCHTVIPALKNAVR